MQSFRGRSLFSTMILAAGLMTTGCGNKEEQKQPSIYTPPAADKEDRLPIQDDPVKRVPQYPPFLQVGVRVGTDSTPEAYERFRGDWVILAQAIDDKAHNIGIPYDAGTRPDGNTIVFLPEFLYRIHDPSAPQGERGFPQEVHASAEPLVEAGPGLHWVTTFPIVVTVINEALAGKTLKAFVPSGTVLAGPIQVSELTDALWSRHYLNISKRNMGFSPSRVTPEAWSSMVATIGAENAIKDDLESHTIQAATLTEVLQKNADDLVKGDEVLCLPSRAEKGSDMDTGATIAAFPYSLGDAFNTVGSDGLIASSSGMPLDWAFEVGVDGTTVAFDGTGNVKEIDEEILEGTLAKHTDVVTDIDVSVYTIRHTNARQDSDDPGRMNTTSMTVLTKFRNEMEEGANLDTNTAFTLKDAYAAVTVYTTESGDNVIDPGKDRWAIVHENGDTSQALLIEVPGFRDGDHDDKLQLSKDGNNLVIKLGRNHKLEGDDVADSEAHMRFTITTASDVMGGFIGQLCIEVMDKAAAVVASTQDLATMSAVSALELVARSACFSQGGKANYWVPNDSRATLINGNSGVHVNVAVPASQICMGSEVDVSYQGPNADSFTDMGRFYTDSMGAMTMSLPGVTDEGTLRLDVRSSGDCKKKTLDIACGQPAAPAPAPAEGEGEGEGEGEA